MSDKFEVDAGKVDAGPPARGGVGDARVQAESTGSLGLEARNDFALTDSDELVLIDIRDNTYLFNTTFVTIVGIDGNAVSEGDTVALDGGGLVTLSNGLLTFDPNGDFDALRAGKVALQSFSFDISDGETRSTATVRVGVEGTRETGSNRPNTDTAATNERELITIDLTENDPIPSTSTITIVGIAGEEVSEGDTVRLDNGALVTLNRDGTVDFDPNGAFDDLGAGDLGLARFSYTVSDGTREATAGARVVVEGVDAAIAQDDRARTDEDSATLINVTENDYVFNTTFVTIVGIDGNDVSPGDTVRLAAGGQVIVREGQLVFDPNGAFDDLEAGETTTASFHYTLEDEDGRSTAQVDVVIFGQSDMPLPSTDIL